MWFCASCLTAVSFRRSRVAVIDRGSFSRPRDREEDVMKGAFGVPFLVALLHVHSTSFAQMSAREFTELPEADQRTVLVSSLQQRQKAVRNLQARSLTHKYKVPYR